MKNIKKLLRFIERKYRQTKEIFFKFRFFLENLKMF